MRILTDNFGADFGNVFRLFLFLNHLFEIYKFPANTKEIILFEIFSDSKAIEAITTTAAVAAVAATAVAAAELGEFGLLAGNRPGLVPPGLPQPGSRMIIILVD